jgi:soluble lytic murein transglycosylase-like protein
LPDDQAFMVRQPADKDPEAQYFEPSQLSNKGSLPDSIPYLDIILKVSREKGVDPALVLAVIQQESSFNPKAHSPAGALGLMQVMPATARSMGLRDPRQLLNPEVNIKYGVQYIKDLWAQFGDKDLSRLAAGDITRDDIKNTIAAYNAGPGNVQKYHGVPPFRETQNYLVRVSANFEQFKNLSDTVLTADSGSRSFT